MKNFRFVGYIHNVIEPTIVNGFDSPKSKNKLKSSSGKPSKSGTKFPGKPDVVVLSDEEGQNGQAEVKSPTTSKKNSSWPDAKSYQYIVKLQNKRNTPSKTPEMITVKQSCIR